MMTSAHYGFLLGIAMFVSTNLAPQPAGSIVLFGFFTLQMGWAAVAYWRRTGLPFVTAAMVNASVMSLCLAVLAAVGRPLRDMSTESWVFYGGAGVTGMVLLQIESRVNKAKVNACRAYMKHKSVWDVVTGRHIPDLRKEGGISAPMA